MWNIFVQAFSWLMLIFIGSQILIFIGLALWDVWTNVLKPHLIPADNIDRVAADIIANYSDPELEAFARHKRAWNRSDGAEQTYWHRVRKAVWRQLERR